MNVSVVVCVYNREDLIERCVRALLAALGAEDELIVVDDASTDRTPNILASIHHPRFKTIRNSQNQKPSYSRNQGIKESQGKFIAFVDADCVVESNWIVEIIKPFKRDPKIMIVSGFTMDPPATTYWEMVNEGVNHIANKERYVKEAHTCNMAVWAGFIKENGFDESLPYSEDLDLCLHYQSKGFKIFYTPYARLTHFHRSNALSTIRSYFCWGTYNAYVRLRWNQFPYLNYGSYLLIVAVLVFLLGFHAMGSWLLLIYLILLFCVGFRPGGKNLFKLCASYPAGIVIAVTNCIGNIRGLWLFLTKKR